MSKICKKSFCEKSVENRLQAVDPGGKVAILGAVGSKVPPKSETLFGETAMRKTRRNFNDSELSLFGTLFFKAPDMTAARGHGSMPHDNNDPDVLKQIKACRYSVVTQIVGQYAKRFFRTTLTPWTGSSVRRVEVELQADAKNLRGYNFLSIRIGDNTVWLTQKDARNLAQVLNASANSCNANWRKSSITI